MNYRQAISLAAKSHSGQMYGNKPYFTHLKSVSSIAQDRMFILGDFGIDEVVSVAYLHDILEDTTVTQKELRASFSPSIVDAVVSVTKKKGQSYKSYIKGVKENPLSLFIKQCDTLANLRQSIQDNDDWRILKYSEQFKLLMEK